MSGVRNLANAIANDPSFASQTKGVMTKAEAAEFVSAKTDTSSNPANKSAQPSTPKPRSY